MSSIRTLRIFLAAARLGSFAAAGKEVGLTAAAVGLQVRALEADLGQALFERSGRAVNLSAEGRARLAPIQQLLARYDALRAGDEAGPLSGTVVVGALVSALMGAFADGLWVLKRRHPQLDVRLLAGLSAEFARAVDRGELDAAVVTQPPATLAADLVWTELYAEPMVLIVPRRPHFALPEAALDILAETPFMRFDRQAWTGHLVNAALAQCGATVREGMELNSVEAIVALVRQGFGVSIVPQLANVQWARDQALRIVPLPGVDVRRHVGLLERRHHGRERFTAEIKAYFASGAARRGRAGSGGRGLGG